MSINHKDPRFIQFALGSCYAHAHKRIDNIMKVYIERNNKHVELIRFRKNTDFIDIENFEMGIRFRNCRVYEIGLIAIRDESPLFCAGGAGRFGTRPLQYTPFWDIFNLVHSHFGTCPFWNIVTSRHVISGQA